MAETLTESSIATLVAGAPCQEFQELQGDPNFYGPSLGFNCFLESGALVAFRYYQEDQATKKVVGDWASGIDDSNQIVYSSNWFATGPGDVLDNLFGRYAKTGPTASTPPVKLLDREEHNLTVCSSLTYYVVGTAIGSQRDGELTPYFLNYPGLSDLTAELESRAVSDGIVEYASRDDLRTQVFLTRYDNTIKAFCLDFGM